MLDIIIETVVDNIKLFPFLFGAFLFIELLEHKFSHHTNDIIKKSGKFGPLLGAILGMFPQCGFSVMATNLYITRIISLGTLISVYLSTSDEMLPILLSRGADMGIIFKILLIKVVIGMCSGFLIDLLYRNKKYDKNDYHICEEEHCHCEKGIIMSSLKHTINIWLFLVAVSFCLNIIMEYVGNDVLISVFNNNSLFAPMLASLVGLIPNCGSSVVITELYLNGIIPLSSVVAGLLTGSGVAMIVLFKSNDNLSENIKILFYVYSIGVISGLFIEVLEFL